MHLTVNTFTLQRNDYDGYSVSVISTSNNTVIESVSLGESYDPYGGSGCLALTPNGEYIYAANGGWSYSNSISVISLTPSSTYAITVSQGAHGTISPGTTTVNYGGSQEFTFTPATGYHIVESSVTEPPLKPQVRTLFPLLQERPH